jgi:lysophospholipase L1-like esterase
MLKFLTLSLLICSLWADAPYEYPFYQQELQEIKQMKASKIIFLGDSLTHRHNWSNFKASNMGIDGDTTDGVLSRMRLTDKAETIVLMIGANDILQRTAMSKIQKNYSKILNTFKSHQKIYVLSVLPVVDDKQTKAINQDILSLNRWLKNEVKKQKMHFVNFYPHFLQGKGLAHPLTTDGVHLTSKGYKLWEKLLRDNVFN